MTVVVRNLAAGTALGLVLAFAAPSVMAQPAAPSASSAAPAPAKAPAKEVKLYTPDADPLWSQPYIDVDEWRDGPVRHRYVHGGFKGTATRFSFYFPEKSQYQGRFFQHLTPVPQSENLAQEMPAGRFNKIGFAIDSGAYFVETNGGESIDIAGGNSVAGDMTITAYRANAAAAQYSRKVAQEMYGGKRPYGYAYGGSGGAYRTIGSIESTRGVWDGVVPYVPGSPMAIPNMFTVRLQAMRILEHKFPQILDAVSPGGSGDPYAGLNEREAGALREVTKMGFEPQSWFAWKTMGAHGFAALYPPVKMVDSAYFKDFWTKPGYLGHDDPERFAGGRMQFTTTVAQAITAAEAARLRISTDAAREDRGGVDNAFKAPTGAAGERIVAYRLASAPPAITFIGGDLDIGSGARKGKSMPVARIVGDIVVLGIAQADTAANVKPGDEVTVDNSNWLAMESYHRHQVPGPEYKVWDQFRDAAGKPLYPQRPMLLGPLFTKATTGSGMTGKFEGKMIIAASLWDREALPWQADWYRQKAAAQFGKAADDHLRLYYTDHALHGDEPGSEDENRVVTYAGVLQQALRDLSAWVEKGIAPPESTRYRIEDGQVVVPQTAAERRGIQPVVTLTVGGGERVEVKVGEPVTFRGTIVAPPSAGKVVDAGWDFEGNSTFVAAKGLRKGAKVNLTATHTYAAPGTYFVALRGTSQRQGDAKTPYARIDNLGRVRVVVKPADE